MKIILGGVPFGRGNIGDEAILNCAVGIFRRNFPEAHLAVATFKPEEAAAKFDLETLPAFGFDKNYSMSDFRKAARKFDMFVWAGGTGLSDYPQIGASLLENAQKLVGDKLEYAGNAYEAAEGADVLVILTEWPEFAELDLARLKKVMRHNNIVDLRNKLRPEDAQKAGFVYQCIGWCE